MYPCTAWLLKMTVIDDLLTKWWSHQMSKSKYLSMQCCFDVDSSQVSQLCESQKIHNSHGVIQKCPQISPQNQNWRVTMGLWWQNFQTDFECFESRKWNPNKCQVSPKSWRRLGRLCQAVHVFEKFELLNLATNIQVHILHKVSFIQYQLLNKFAMNRP